MRRYLAGELYRFDAVERRGQTEIGNQQVKMIRFNQFQRGWTVLGRANRESIGTQHRAQHGLNLGVVIDDEYSR